MLNSYNFKSIFQNELNYFVKYKRSLGLKYENEISRLRYIDNILYNLNLKSKKITKETFYKLTERNNTHGENYLETSEGKKLPVEHCIRGTEGHRLCPQVDAAAEACGAQILDKVTFGSKELPKLVEELAGGAPESIELAGLCTDICVISNALLLKAFFPETPILVDASACAGVTPESHENALKAMAVCQIDIIQGE